MTNDEILREFLLETHENLALLDSDLVRLETHPTESSTLAQVFRTLHSIKGTAGFMGLVKLQAVAHAAESLLSRLRAGELRFNRPIANALLRVVDAIREIVARIEANGVEGTSDYTAITAELERLRDSTEPSVGDITGVVEISGDDFAVEGESVAEGRWTHTAQMPVDVSAVLPVKKEPPKPEPEFEQVTSNSLPQFSGPIESRELKSGGVAESTIRVDVGLLDKLMTQVGELVLARNQLLQAKNRLADDGFNAAVQRLNHLTTDLQSSVMKTRMQPVGALLSKFSRIVRDLSAACGKQVRFELEGQETELDKTLLEAMRDPLTHLVRNAVDHGIELPAVRVANRKPAEGRLRILAYHEGGKVVIEIGDDGCGIDVERVRTKAIANRLISSEAAARMSTQELTRMIFLPGFSTADQVTQFSGRGVGMDVVRTNIERIGGTVEVESFLGRGTTIRTKIPLTLAIIPALIVGCRSQRYLIPQSSLLELVQLNPEREARGIETVQGAPVYRLRGDLLPLVFLDRQLRLDDPCETEAMNIVVLQVEGKSFGLVVDSIRDTEEIVVKPLQQQLASIPLFAGAAILGDGCVSLVLDVLGLAQQAGVVSVEGTQWFEERERHESVAEEELPPVLLFHSTKNERMAIPLAEVARIEQFEPSDFEVVGGRVVVQYRSGILPMIDVAGELSRLQSTSDEKLVTVPENFFHAREAEEDTESDALNRDESVGLTVVVCELEGQSFGLLVGHVLDIVHERPIGVVESCRPGVAFTAILLDRVTEFVDVGYLAQAALGWFSGEATDD